MTHRYIIKISVPDINRIRIIYIQRVKNMRGINKAKTLTCTISYIRLCKIILQTYYHRIYIIRIVEIKSSQCLNVFTYL